MCQGGAGQKNALGLKKLGTLGTTRGNGAAQAGTGQRATARDVHGAPDMRYAEGRKDTLCARGLNKSLPTLYP